MGTSEADHMTIDEAAEIIGCSKQTVYTWIKENLIPTVTVRGGPRRKVMRILRKDCIRPPSTEANVPEFRYPNKSKRKRHRKKRPYRPTKIK